MRLWGDMLWKSEMLKCWDITGYCKSAWYWNCDIMWGWNWWIWLLWGLHDTEIVVPSRDDNRSIGQSTVICTSQQTGDCGQWSTDWRLWPAVIWLETDWGFPLMGLPEREIAPSLWEGHNVNSFGTYIGLERSASGMARVEHQGLYMNVSREIGFEKGMNENFSNECIDLNWTWQGDWSVKWKKIWVIYILLNLNCGTL